MSDKSQFETAADPTPVPPASLTSLSLVARNATLNLVTEGWIFLVLLVAMPKLVSYLGETHFGLFSLAWVLISYLTFLDVGVSRAATKFVSEHIAEQNHDDTRQIIRTAFVSNLALGLLGGLAVVLVTPYLVHSVFKVSANLQNPARLVFFVAGFAVPVLLIQGVFRAVLSSYQRFGWINGINSVTSTVQWAAAGLLAWKGHGVALVVLSTVIARVLSTAAYGVVMFRLLPGLHLFRVGRLHGLRKLLRFGGWVTVSQLVSPLLVYLDRVLIAAFASLAAVTLYTVPYEMMTRLRIIPSSLVSTLYPAFSERGMEGQNAQLQRLYQGSLRYLLILILPGVLFLLVFGTDLLSLWMGAPFAHQTAMVLQILAVGVLLNCMANVPYNALQALGRPDITGIFHLVELPFYVILCVILIPRWGIAGAALANSIRISADAVLLFWAFHKYCRCSLGPLWTTALPRIVAQNILLALALVTIDFTLTALSGRMEAATLAIGIYFLGGWLFLLDKRDKPRIGNALKLLVGRPAL